MDKIFYGVVKGGISVGDEEWFYQGKDAAEKKFEEESEKLMNEHGYYDYDEEDEDDVERRDEIWDVSEDTVEFFDKDVYGCDDFGGFVRLIKCKFED